MRVVSTNFHASFLCGGPSLRPEAQSLRGVARRSNLGLRKSSSRPYVRNLSVLDEMNLALLALLGAQCSSLLPNYVDLVAG